MYLYVLRVQRTSNYTCTVDSCPYTSANRCGKLLWEKNKRQSKNNVVPNLTPPSQLKIYIYMKTVERMEIHLSFTCEPSNLSFQKYLPHFLYPHPMFYNTVERETLKLKIKM